MRRRDIRALRREKRKPWAEQPRQEDRDAELDSAFRQLAQEQAQRVARGMKEQG